MSETTEAAAERLRRVNAGVKMWEDIYETDSHSMAINLQLKDLVDLSSVVLRETDPRPVDEAFARSVGRSDGGAMHSKHFAETYRVSKTISLLNVIEPGSDEWELHIGDEFIHNPTIGEFWTACRLFRVQVKEQA